MKKHEGHEASRCRKKGNETEPHEALVVVESAVFRQFEHRIDTQLATLVQRWAHTAAPCAMRSPGNRISQTALKPSKPK
jgi:hypothetical protein